MGMGIEALDRRAGMDERARVGSGFVDKDQGVDGERARDGGEPPGHRQRRTYSLSSLVLSIRLISTRPPDDLVPARVTLLQFKSMIDTLVVPFFDSFLHPRYHNRTDLHLSAIYDLLERTHS